jgi:ankyrin repeat protein
MLTKRRVIDQLNSVNGAGQTALHIAIENNFYDVVELLLQTYMANLNKVDIHIKDRNGYTALHAAAESDDPKMLKALLQYPGIQPNVKTGNLNTPLHCFCNKWTSPTQLPELLSLFIERGAIINAQNRSKETALHKAALNPVVRLLLVPLLLKNGADVNIPNKHGETPLHYAIHQKRKDLVLVLLEGGADPNLKGTVDGKTALELAQSQPGNEEILQILHQVQELSDWLHKIEMSKYLPNFLKQTLFLDVISLVNDNTLVGMGINNVGDRLRIVNNVQQYAGKWEPERV